MKTFDLELAKKGFPVCTRDGRDARIICFDRNDSHAPIVALVKEKEGCEGTSFHRNDGSDYVFGIPTYIESNADLFMKTAQRTGWVNLYRGTNKTVFCGHRVYESEEAALAGKKGKYEYITSQQVTWEE